MKEDGQEVKVEPVIQGGQESRFLREEYSRWWGWPVPRQRVEKFIHRLSKEGRNRKQGQGRMGPDTETT